MTERHENLLEAYFAGQLTDAERAEFIAMLESDEKFATRFREMEEAYVAACIPAFEQTKKKNFRLIQERISPHRREMTFWKSIAVASCVAVVALICTLIYNNVHGTQNADGIVAEPEVMTIVAKSGTGTEAILPDGTRVCLNASSSLSYSKAREVTLDGEGYFEVVSDIENPFRVHAGNTCVTVTGTVFNVRNYSDEPEVEVSLLDGSVVLDTDSSHAVLTPGSCGIVSRDDSSIRVEEADPFVSAWVKGKFVFTDMSIPEILHAVARNYGVRFIYDDNLFAGERFTGNISFNLSIDEILSYIDVDKKYRWTRRDKTIEIFKH